jgi:hypothetical protein
MPTWVKILNRTPTHRLMHSQRYEREDTEQDDDDRNDDCENDDDLHVVHFSSFYLHRVRARLHSLHSVILPRRSAGLTSITLMRLSVSRKLRPDDVSFTPSKSQGPRGAAG